MSDDDSKGNWSIKDMPVISRKKALAAATKRGETMSEWMVRAIDSQSQIETGDKVLPPPFPISAKPAENAPPAQVALHLTIAEIRDAAEAAKAIAEATGKPVPKTHANHIYALLTTHYRAARGLPPVARRKEEKDDKEGKKGDHALIEGKAE